MEGDQSSTARRYPLIAVLVVSICCAFLLWTNHTLQNQNKEMFQQLQNLEAAQGPPVGLKISFLKGTNTAGQRINVDLTQREQRILLLVLSPVCPYSKENFHNWKDVLPLVPAKNIIWVDITDTVDSNYLTSVGIPLDASVIRLDPEERTLYNLGTTPTTVLLAPHGIVKWAWASVLDNEQMDQLRYLLRSTGA